MKIRFRKIGILIMAAVLLTFSVGSTGASATSGSLSDAQQKKQELEDDLQEAQELIKQLETDKSDIESAVVELDQKLTNISEKISDLEEQLEQKNQELSDTQTQLEEAQAQEADQYESMKVRIRYMYENSGMSYIEALISSGSFAELLKQADYFSSIMDYDRDMLEEYQELQATIQNAEEVIKQDKEDLENLQAQLEEEQEAVSLLMAEKENQLAVVESNLSDAELEADQYEALIEDENQIIAQIQAAEAAAKAAEEAAKKKAEEEAAKKAAEEAAKKEAEAAANTESESKSETESSQSSSSTETSSNVNTSSSYTGGTFTWPVPSSSRITSYFGNRTAPTAGASTYHRGIDIGASSGSAIVAAADGVVTTASYSSGNGNYVILSHGGGLYTVYCHCSSLNVSQGQSVTRGSTIAKVGSTGISTGPHLHFAVMLNGSYVDPMNYL
jgi:murein DD-endopeptidase MepM/ murein hydrolase activator NlpD